MATLPVYDDPKSAIVSVRDYLSTNYRPDCEYVDGRIEERNVGEYDHGFLQALLAQLFLNNGSAWGVRAVTDVRIQVKPANFRVPDVSVLRLGSPKERISPIRHFWSLRFSRRRTVSTTILASALRISGLSIPSAGRPTAQPAQDCILSKISNLAFQARPSGLC